MMIKDKIQTKKVYDIIRFPQSNSVQVKQHWHKQSQHTTLHIQEQDRERRTSKQTGSSHGDLGICFIVNWNFVTSPNNFKRLL